ncbi:MAG: alpha/beta fold hydrolase [Phycisphaeraceae bacterium]
MKTPGWRRPLVLWAFIRRFPCWQVYVVLLILSLAVRSVVPSWTEPGDGKQQRLAEVPRVTSDGPIGGEPIRLAYREWGDPDNPVKIVALHGSPAIGSTYDKLGPILGEHAHVVAPFMPGYGMSSKWVPDYGIKANARYTLALMDELGIDSAHVLGYSIGSGVGLWMEEIDDQRVDSLLFYGGIGIQEGEGSGDFHFEHFKYRVGYLLLVVGGEMTPHFGLLGPLHFRHAFLRNFTDLDQRPLRGILEGLNDTRTPLLILQDHEDFFVSSNTAREHHDIVRHSHLVILDGAHGLVFSPDGSRRLADEIVPFVETFEDPAAEPTRRTEDPYGPIERPTLDLPLLDQDLGVSRRMNPWMQMGAIMFGTYVLEDPTTVFTGILVSKGLIDPFVAVLAIFFGIFTGDLALYLLGRVFGARALRWRFIEKRLPAHHVDRLGNWFDRHGWTAVLASRFLPGSRLPLYVSAGALGRKPGRFALWTCLAVMIWAPVMLLLVVLLGDAALSQSRAVFGNTWIAILVTLIFVLLVLRVLILSTTKVGRSKLKASVARLWRYEFWPPYVFYLPLLPVVARLALRHGGLKTLTAVNPAMPESGFVDESKIDILSALPERWIVPSDVLDAHDAEQALGTLHGLMGERGWSYPLILKPDAGQRGYAVRKIDDDDEAIEYFTDVTGRVLVQTYHPGPHEAGVFYIRRPDEERGRIFSITDKVFPTVTGDGKRTLEELIFRDRRLRMQAGVFLNRFADESEDVIPEGETRSLAVSGNHAQGTLFRDGSHLQTDALEARIDEIARQYEGFYFGRFDLRYTDPEAFKRGEDLAIVELNGVTSESTNLYDPDRSLWWAYGVLFAQWREAFAIGDINRKRGAEATSIWKVWRKMRHHYRHRTRHGRAD